MKLKILLIACLIANISQVYSDPKIMKQMKKMDSIKVEALPLKSLTPVL